MSHYETLGVAKNATPDDIKKAYRKLASQHHPDKGGDTATFQKIQAAYETLSDPNKKQEYDNPRPQFEGGFPGGFQFHTQGFDINDIFSQVFGGMRGQPQQPRQQVFRTIVQVTLEDAYNGASNNIKLQTPTGVKMVKIDVPKGIDNGGQLRYENIIEGASLIVEFRISPHLKFERRGHDLYCTHHISVLDLIVGTKFEFTTLSGKTLEVSVPSQTQPHMQLKIAGSGMPISNQGSLYGDQIILLKPVIPANIDDEIIKAILRSKNK